MGPAGRPHPVARQPAAVLVTVKDKSLRDGLQPSLTVTARGGQSESPKARDEEMVANRAEKEMRKTNQDQA